MIVLSAEGLSAFQVCREGREGLQPLGQDQRPHCPASVAGEGETTTVALSTTERPLIRSDHPEATPDVLGKPEEINMWMTAATRRA